MKPELIAEFTRLAAPLPAANDRGAATYLWFEGTVDQAAQSLLLREHGVPGEGGRPKSFTIKLDGRSVNIRRYTNRLVQVCFNATREERAAHDKELARQYDEREKLAKAAELQAKLQEDLQKELEALKGQPATEEDFRSYARESFWRLWSTFRAIYLGSHGPHASGYRFTSATVDVLEGFVCSVLWTLDADGEVVFDEATRTAKVRKLQAEVCKADAPLQRFLAGVTALPMAPAESDPGGPR